MGKRTYFLYSFLAFACVFLYIDPFCTGLGRSIQACFTILMMTFLLRYKKKYLYVRKFKPINICCYFLIGSILVTSLLNKNLYLGDYKLSSYTLGILYAVIIFNTLSFVEYSIIQRKVGLMFSYFFKICLVTCIIVDLLIFSVGPLAHAYYYIGDKFTVSYLHLFLLSLYTLNYRVDKSFPKNRIKLLGLFALTILVCQRVSCSTGQIGAVLLVLLLLFKRSRFVIATSNRMLICVIVFTLISFAFEYLLEYPLFKDFIVNVLGKDDTMTGRTDIYLVLWKAVQINPWFGWGQGNGMSFMGYYFSTPNAQNGFFNYVTDYGFVGAFIMLAFLYIVCSKVNSKKSYPLWGLIAVLVVLSSVEITFNLQFIIYIILLLPFMYSQKI